MAKTFFYHSVILFQQGLHHLLIRGLLLAGDPVIAAVYAAA